MLTNKSDSESYNPSLVSPGWLGFLKKEDEEQNDKDVKVFSSCCCHPASISPKIATAKYLKQKISQFKMDDLEVGFDSYPCDDFEYIKTKVFPILLPGIKNLLLTVKSKNVLDRKRSSFNGCDYLTEYLYKNNRNYNDRDDVGLWDISFVQKINSIRPRPPLPLSLQWTDEEAAIVLQSAWRGYVVRCDPDVQELRQYQKEMREEAYDINFKIEEFWKQHPIDIDSQTDDIDDIEYLKN